MATRKKTPKRQSPKPDRGTSQPVALPNTPPLAKEILEVIVSSFQPSQDAGSFSISSDSDSLKGKPLVVARLLTENPWEKAALAQIYEQHVIRRNDNNSNSTWALAWSRTSQPRRQPVVFIESGSTCVYVSELLRRLAAQEGNSLRDFHLGTNNHLTAWLFLNRDRYLTSPIEDDVASLVPNLFAGQLESKYHGIFPFYRRKDDIVAQDERNGYAQLRLSLARSDLLMLAASRLSLKYGPLVGSRENAIFKNACYNACVPPIDGEPSQKDIHLFITVQKLVAHNEENQSNAHSQIRFRHESNIVERPPFTDCHTWHEELTNIYKGKCFPAFDLSLDDFRPSAGIGSRLKRSPFSTDLIPAVPQRLRDGTAAVEMGDGRFRICYTWQELFTKARLTVKVFVAFKGRTNKSDPYYKWITSEVNEALNTFQQIGIRIEVTNINTLIPRGHSSEFSLVLIQISPANDTEIPVAK